MKKDNNDFSSELIVNKMCNYPFSDTIWIRYKEGYVQSGKSLIDWVEQKYAIFIHNEKQENKKVRLINISSNLNYNFYHNINKDKKSPLIILNGPIGMGKTFFIGKLIDNLKEGNIKSSFFKNFSTVNALEFYGKKCIKNKVVVKILYFLVLNSKTKKEKEAIINFITEKIKNEKEETAVLIESLMEDVDLKIINPKAVKRSKVAFLPSLIFIDNVDILNNEIEIIIQAINEFRELGNLCFVILMDYDRVFKNNVRLKKIVNKYSELPMMRLKISYSSFLGSLNLDSEEIEYIEELIKYLTNNSITITELKKLIIFEKGNLELDFNDLKKLLIGRLEHYFPKGKIDFFENKFKRLVSEMLEINDSLCEVIANFSSISKNNKTIASNISNFQKKILNININDDNFLYLLDLININVEYLEYEVPINNSEETTNISQRKFTEFNDFNDAFNKWTAFITLNKVLSNFLKLVIGKRPDDFKKYKIKDLNKNSKSFVSFLIRLFTTIL